MKRIPPWDGSAETWTKHENEVLWFKQTLKPSERPHCLVLRRKQYSQRVPRRLLEKTLGNTSNSCSTRLESFQFPDLGNQLDDYFFRLKRATGGTMAEWSIRFDGVYRRLLSALERTTGKKHRSSVHDSSTETKRVEPVDRFEMIDDFEDNPSVNTGGSRPWSMRSGPLQSGRFGRSKRVLDEFGIMRIPRLNLAPNDPRS